MHSPPADHSPVAPLLEIRNLSVRFPAQNSLWFKAVNDLSLTVGNGETVALVGESGCGKSVTALSIMRLLQKPGEIVSGRILFDGTDLLTADEKTMQAVRGASISMIFQEPMTSLNPVLTIGFQITEAILQHKTIAKTAAAAEAVELLSLVGIPAAAERFAAYPHQLSGGMKQRVMIAMALACSPRLLIADEPTTALDVTIQAQILGLLDRLQESFGMSLLLITHNLGIVSDRADQVMVMYAGSVVESGPSRAVLSASIHPYTQGLLASLPQSSAPGNRIPTISGMYTPEDSLAPGCPFVPRCPYAAEQCRIAAPQLVEIRPGHAASCWMATP